MQPLTCPQCGVTGEASDQQVRGEQSLVCPACGFHGYSNKSKLNVGTLPVIDIERFLVNSPRYSPYRRDYRAMYEGE